VNSLEKARSMVQAAGGRETPPGGHQRRSNPRYVPRIDRLIRGQENARPGLPRLRPVEPVQERYDRLAEKNIHDPAGDNWKGTAKARC